MNQKILREEYDVCINPKQGRPQSVAGQEKFGTGPDVCLEFLRQLTVIYHFIHFRLDRPFLDDSGWPACMEALKNELERSLLDDEVPPGWLESLMIFRRNENEVARFNGYDYSRGPLFAAGRRNIETALQKLRAIESNSGGFERQKERNQFIREELRKLSNWALGKAWEVTSILGWENL